jgi:predicted  nucleic acid-binding Zn-ribbon protein
VTKVLPKLREAQQLCRLRALRVQRARDVVAAAQADVERAAQALRARQLQVEKLRREIDDLQNAIVTSLAPSLPRWSDVTGAQRERLTDRLERDEYALIEDERKLEAAQEKLQQARAELTRALAREDVVRDIANQSRRAQTQDRDRRAEREIEDQGRPAPAAKQR